MRATSCKAWRRWVPVVAVAFFSVESSNGISIGVVFMTPAVAVVVVGCSGATKQQKTTAILI